MVCFLRELLYEFEFLGTPKYDIDGVYGNSPNILLIDNQETIKMSENYKVTAKNRHVARRWHFVRWGVEGGVFKLFWMPTEDQLANDMTKTQVSSKSLPHFIRTLIKVPDFVKGYRRSTIGNR